MLNKKIVWFSRYHTLSIDMLGESPLQAFTYTTVCSNLFQDFYVHIWVFMEIYQLAALKHSVHGLLEGFMSECHLISQGNWISELPRLMVALSCYAVQQPLDSLCQSQLLIHLFISRWLVYITALKTPYSHPSVYKSFGPSFGSCQSLKIILSLI